MTGLQRLCVLSVTVDVKIPVSISCDIYVTMPVSVPISLVVSHSLRTERVFGSGCVEQRRVTRAVHRLDKLGVSTVEVRTDRFCMRGP